METILGSWCEGLWQDGLRARMLGNQLQSQFAVPKMVELRVICTFSMTCFLNLAVPSLPLRFLGF